MKLNCQVKIVRQDLSGDGVGGSKRYVQAFLYFSQKSTRALPKLIVATAKNRGGDKYLIRNNLVDIFDRMLGEGKLTLRFKNPSVDICIKDANPADIFNVIQTVKAAYQDQSIVGCKFTSIETTLKSKEFVKSKTVLKISSLKEYQKAFPLPLSLTSLCINNCSLNGIYTRVLGLENLTSLDLSHNSIRTLPDALNNLRLSFLCLSHNQIEFISPGIFAPSSKLAVNLRSLDLSENGLRYWPSVLNNIKKLHTLNIHSNRLLTADFRHFTGLVHLSIHDNCFPYLPFSITRLRLHTLNAFPNPFLYTADKLLEGSKLFESDEVPSLQEICSKHIIESETAYQHLPYLIRLFINSHEVCCVCRKPTFSGHFRFLMPCILNQYAWQVTLPTNSNGMNEVNVEHVICSTGCILSTMRTARLYQLLM